MALSALGTGWRDSRTGHHEPSACAVPAATSTPTAKLIIVALLRVRGVFQQTLMKRALKRDRVIRITKLWRN